MGAELSWSAVTSESVQLPAFLEAEQVPLSRILYLNDRNVSLRRDWLVSVFPDFEDARYNELDTTLLVSSIKPYSLFLLHGDDSSRMAKIMRCNSEILAGKLKIALCNRSYPSERALLLNSGFDDVFDLRMDPVEAISRIFALRRRRSITENGFLSQFSRETLVELKSYASTSLTRREYEVLGKLVSMRGAAVSIAELKRSSFVSIQCTSDKAMQVFICRLRRKLKKGVSINYVSYGGYAISLGQ